MTDVLIIFFFFKQKTAYEILTCDWSSDVCSSDLCFSGNLGFGFPTAIESSKHKKYCDRHKDEMYSGGCENCYQLFCFLCMNSPPGCTTGEGSLHIR